MRKIFIVCYIICRLNNIKFYDTTATVLVNNHST
ncbi:hypothetical protein GFV14_00501 [Candidatus Hartigia pinicola]|nr:hypothetical protein GFV14_00501 [Candidatus Hartigia pinicola]